MAQETGPRLVPGPLAYGPPDLWPLRSTDPSQLVESRVNLDPTASYNRKSLYRRRAALGNHSWPPYNLTRPSSLSLVSAGRIPDWPPSPGLDPLVLESGVSNLQTRGDRRGVGEGCWGFIPGLGGLALGWSRLTGPELGLILDLQMGRSLIWLRWSGPWMQRLGEWQEGLEVISWDGSYHLDLGLVGLIPRWLDRLSLKPLIPYDSPSL